MKKNEFKVNGDLLFGEYGITFTKEEIDRLALTPYAKHITTLSSEDMVILTSGFQSKLGYFVSVDPVFELPEKAAKNIRKIAKENKKSPNSVAQDLVGEVLHSESFFEALKARIKAEIVDNPEFDSLKIQAE